MCNDYDSYRQCYCGCVFAAKAQAIDIVQTQKEAKDFMEGKNAEQEFSHNIYALFLKEMISN